MATVPDPQPCLTQKLQPLSAGSSSLPSSLSPRIAAGGAVKTPGDVTTPQLPSLMVYQGEPSYDILPQEAKLKGGLKKFSWHILFLEATGGPGPSSSPWKTLPHCQARARVLPGKRPPPSVVLAVGTNLSLQPLNLSRRPYHFNQVELRVFLS